MDFNTYKPDLKGRRKIDPKDIHVGDIYLSVSERTQYFYINKCKGFNFDQQIQETYLFVNGNHIEFDDNSHSYISNFDFYEATLVEVAWLETCIKAEQAVPFIEEFTITGTEALNLTKSFNYNKVNNLNIHTNEHSQTTPCKIDQSLPNISSGINPEGVSIRGRTSAIAIKSRSIRNGASAIKC